MRILLLATASNVISSLKPLVSWGHRVTVCPGLKAAEAEIKKEPIDLVLADLKDLDPDLKNFVLKTDHPRAVMADDPEQEAGFLYQLPRLPDRAKLETFVNQVASTVEEVPLNFESAMVICDDDEELLRDIVEVFVGDAPNHVDGIQGGLKSEDFEQVRRAAHTLKGASGNIAAEPLREVCQLVERAAKKGEAARIRAAFPQLKYEFSRLKKFLAGKWGI